MTFIYLIFTILSLHLSWLFYKSKDGMLREILIWFFLALAWRNGFLYLYHLIGGHTELLKLISIFPLFVTYTQLYIYIYRKSWKQQ